MKTVNNVDPYPWSTVRMYIPDILLFAMLLITLAISFFASIYHYGGSIDWFQRSGSVVTVFSAILEYRHLNIFEKNSTQQCVLHGSISGVPSMAYLAKIRQYIGSSCLYTLAAGTIIWGYGDIPFNN